MTCICERCGASINHIYTWQGKSYGSECVTVVSGIKQAEVKQITEGNVDEYLTKQAERVAKLKADNKAWNDRVEHNTKVNGWLINFLEQYADPNKSNYNGFASNMITELTKHELKDLSEKQFDSLQNMWAYGLTGLDEGIARMEFIVASGIEDMSNPETITESKYFALSFATLKELKELAKQNKIKGYSKMNREQLEESLIEYITF